MHHKTFTVSIKSRLHLSRYMHEVAKLQCRKLRLTFFAVGGTSYNNVAGGAVYGSVYCKDIHYGSGGGGNQGGAGGSHIEIKAGTVRSFSHDLRQYSPTILKNIPCVVLHIFLKISIL